MDTNLLLRNSRCIDSCIPDGAKIAAMIQQLDDISVSVAAGVQIATVITTSIVLNADTATPIVLGLATNTFKRVTFYARKAARTDNTGNVWIQFDAANGGAGFMLAPGESDTFEAPQNRIMNASQFYIDVETANDGVLAIFWS